VDSPRGVLRETLVEVCRASNLTLNIRRSEDQASRGNGERDGSLWVLNLVPHNRRQFQSYQREADHAEGGQQAQVERDAHVVRREVHAEAARDCDAESDQNERRQCGADAANGIDKAARFHPCEYLISLFSIIIDYENSVERYFRP
jgi:hypothetical protein